MFSNHHRLVRRGIVRAVAGIASAAPLLITAACGGDGPSADLSVAVTGPDDSVDFDSIGFPQSVDEDVEEIRFTVAQDNRILSTTSAGWNDSGLSLPRFPFGRDTWIAVEGLINETVVASGATPLFRLSENEDTPALRVLTALVRVFSPAYYFNEDDQASMPLLFELGGQERAGHTMTPLIDGSGVLVIGGAKMGASGTGILGTGITGFSDSIEFYDTRTGAFLSLYEDGCTGAPSECALRLPGGGMGWHTATALPDGRVLIVGGVRATSIGGEQILQPTDDAWLLTLTQTAVGYVDEVATTNTPRAFHTASAFPDGRVALIGGVRSIASGTPTYVDAIEIFDPAFAEIADSGAVLATPRAWHTATYFDESGHGILVVGGLSAAGVAGITEVVYDNGGVLGAEVFTADNSFADLAAPRWGHSVARFSCIGSDEEYLAILGGFTQPGANFFTGTAPTRVVEIYRPRSRFDRAAYEYLEETNQLATGGRAFGVAVTLPLSQDVLYFGGVDENGAPVKFADRLANIWSDPCPVFQQVDRVPDLGAARGHAAGVVLPTGFVLVNGGTNGTASLESSEFYNPDDYRLPEVYPR